MSTKETVQDAPGSTNGAEPIRKPPKARKAPQRRSYASELAELQAEHGSLRGRVEMAVRILKKSIPEGNDPTQGADVSLVEVAIETLEGE